MRYVNPAEFGRIDPKEWREYGDHYTQSLWPDKLPSSPADYGNNDFHGRTHPEIVFVALDRYTKPGDLVWDCFAGSGTTIDVCEKMGNQWIANDITPTGPEIIKADSRTWYPGCPAPLPVDLVVCHPPYMSAIPYPGKHSLATKNIVEWCDAMSAVISNITKVLKLWHVLVVIVGEVYEGGNTYMLDCELYKYLSDYRVLGRVVIRYGESKGGATGGKKNENLWKYRRLKYGIWELGLDIVLFLQKVKE